MRERRWERGSMKVGRIFTYITSHLNQQEMKYLYKKEDQSIFKCISNANGKKKLIKNKIINIEMGGNKKYLYISFSWLDTQIK